MSKRVILLKNQTKKLDKYQKVFEDENFEPIFVPLITHTNIPGEILNLLHDYNYLNSLQCLIVTSQRTVECLVEEILPALDDISRNILINKVVYTVGPTTANFLKAIGFTNILGGFDAGNGDNLADIMITDLLDNDNTVVKDPKDINEILFLVGEIRRDIIPKKLHKRNLKVREVVVYKTEDKVDSLVHFNELYQDGDWVVVFSPQGTKPILNYIKGNDSSCVNYRLVSIGPTTEKYLNDIGMPPVVTSKKPEANSLLDAIKNSQVNNNNII
ncbi:hypothetical protein TPHA_0G00600 [Tetrapisispora phaffii CBS 4417]|uniref:Tetrapyrrole biosynthesis uroporphyrinogen III synthase domain-containing protein n=1 Tax=Tetrapisispora phaffii (strain ATCC 24235 / CBS 4417 / NBRC 1672 / NRRL Y-8282 / UCD 70-5) TaxID=1071381 RepID=G8BVG8_TETPH|nr:hypothetical protein TPHA_0G00600 [Tetrapisispora phaffii CBS 4417]CCE63896.1 hypothetical protein TPHA_0G00600 [Tetrapisispora phaffii CBS 4417]